MKNVLAFIKITAQGGLLVLLPLLLFILLLMEILDMVVSLASPIASLMPAGIFKNPMYPIVMAILLLFVTSLFIGLAMRSAAAIRLGNWIEAKTITKVPIYRFVKELVSGLVGAEKAATFKPALVDCGNGLQEVAYVVEDLGDRGMATLFPHAPTGFAGPVRIVPKAWITPLDASLGDVSLVLNHMGLGTKKLLTVKKPPTHD